MDVIDPILQALRSDHAAKDKNWSTFKPKLESLLELSPEVVAVSKVTYGNLKIRLSERTDKGENVCIASICDETADGGDRIAAATAFVASGACDTVIIFELDNTLTPPEHVPLHLVSLEHSPIRQKLLAHWPSLNDAKIPDPSSIRLLLDSIAAQQVQYSQDVDSSAMRARTEFLQQLANSLVARLNSNPSNQTLSTYPHPGYGFSARVPYIRIFDARYSPVAQQGFYCCVYIAADGSSVMISLQHAAMRSDPVKGKLVKLPKVGLIAASDEYFKTLSNHASFGPILARLGASRHLSLQGVGGAVAGYSEAFAQSNIAGVTLTCASLPTDHELMTHIKEFVEMAAHLNAFGGLPTSSAVLTNKGAFFMSESRKNEMLASLMDKSPQIVLAGPPGTGKTYVARELANILLRQHGVSEDDYTTLVQFHPTYGYEDFVEGLRPVANEQGQIEFKAVSGPILRLAKEIQNDEIPRVLIIDEINRANIPRVFGELMYLLEYRDETINLMLHSGFKLPRQLYIIATMNTADKSTRIMDAALRRRFDFFALDPDVEVLRQHYESGEAVNELGEELYEGFLKLNATLADDLDKHRLIGHSYFMEKYFDVQTLRARWDRQIGPLLDEYFFERQATENQYSLEGFFPSAGA